MPSVNPAVTGVSAFFPCYNDEHTIERMVRSVHETLERLGIAQAMVANIFLRRSGDRRGGPSAPSR